jgi:hypothetical protein
MQPLLTDDVALAGRLEPKRKPEFAQLHRAARWRLEIDRKQYLDGKAQAGN